MGYTPQQKLAAMVKREKNRTRAVELHLQGLTLRQIGKVIGTSHVTAKRYLDDVRAEWLEVRIEDWAAAREDIRHRLLAALQEAWTAWERSKLEHESSRSRRKTRPTTDRGEAASVEEEVELRKEKRIGNPRFLERIESIVDKLARLDGCYKQAETPPLTLLQAVQIVIEGQPAATEDSRLLPAELNGDGNGQDHED